MAFDAVSQSEENSSESHLPSQIISQQIPRMENDDGSAIPIRTGIQCQLTCEEVHKIMGSCDPNQLRQKAPMNIKGGNIYMFSYRSINDRALVAMDYCGKMMLYGPTRRKIQNFGKAFSFIYSNTNDKENIDVKKVGVVHYISDETYPQPRAHRNSTSDKPFIGNGPIMKDKILAISSNRRGRKETYTSLLNAQEDGLEAVLKPQNTKQVENFQWQEIQQKLHPTQNALFNLFQFMRKGKNQFVHKFDSSLKDLAVKCMLKEVRTVVEERITDYPNDPLILLYNTTFQLGDFYASALIMPHRCLVNENIILVAVLLHEQKFAQTHLTLMKWVFEQLPTAVTTGRVQVVFITDGKFDFQSLTPNLNHVYCWRHLIENLKRQIGQVLSLPKDLQNIIIKDIYSILKMHTSDLAEQKAMKCSKN